MEHRCRQRAERDPPGQGAGGGEGGSLQQEGLGGLCRLPGVGPKDGLRGATSISGSPCFKSGRLKGPSRPVSHPPDPASEAFGSGGVHFSSPISPPAPGPPSL